MARHFPLWQLSVMRFLAIFSFTMLLLAHAAAEPAEPRLQDATIVAKDGTIAITRLPIRTPSGVIYRDVTIELHVDSTGRVTLATDGAGRALADRGPGNASGQVALRAVPSGTPAEGENAIELPQRPSQPVVFQHFAAGTYAAPDGTLVRLKSVGTVTADDIPAWTLTADNGPITSAEFYSGPPRINPQAYRLSRAGITAEDYAYGLSSDGGNETFGAGAMLGVLQSGGTLVVVSFKRGCCTNGSRPVGSIVYTRVTR